MQDLKVNNNKNLKTKLSSINILLIIIDNSLTNAWISNPTWRNSFVLCLSH